MLLDINVAKQNLVYVLLKKDLQHCFFDKIAIVAVSNTVSIVLAWVLIPSSKPQPSNFFHPPRHQKNLISPSRHTKNPDNSNMLHMFNSNTYTDFRTAYTCLNS